MYFFSSGVKGLTRGRALCATLHPLRDGRKNGGGGGGEGWSWGDGGIWDSAEVVIREGATIWSGVLIFHLSAVNTRVLVPPGVWQIFDSLWLCVARNSVLVEDCARARLPARLTAFVLARFGERRDTHSLPSNWLYCQGKDIVYCLDSSHRLSRATENCTNQHWPWGRGETPFEMLNLRVTGKYSTKSRHVLCLQP